MNAFMRLAACMGTLVLAFHGLEMLSATLDGYGVAERWSKDAGTPTLEEQRQAVLARTQARLRILGKLAERSLTLPQAAARFQQLENAMSPVQQLYCRQVYPARSDKEHFCLEVIAHATHLQINAASRRELVRDLQKQLEEGLAGHPFRLSVSAPSAMP